MELSLKKLPNLEVEMEIEVPAEEFNQFIEKATLRLGKDLEIKGFRKGKVPKEIIKKEIGPEKILIEAADSAVRENYQKAVRQLAEDNKIEVISQPKIEIKKLAQGNPFIFSAKTSVLPEIKLADYKKIASKVKKRKIEVEEKEVEAGLKWVQRSRAKLTIKNQPAQKGDFVEIEYWLDSLGENQSRKDGFILGEGYFLPGFEDKIIGMKADEEKNNLILKKEGKEIKAKVKVNSVQNIEFPELNDKFAKSLGNFESLEALKRSIKEGLGLEKERAESLRLRNEILDKIGQLTKCEIPEALIREKQNQMLDNSKNKVKEQLKIAWQDYLKKINKTEKEILDSFLLEARKRIRNFLILREIGKREKIKVSEQEVKKEAGKILTREPLDLEKLKDYTKEALRTEKTWALLEGLAGKSNY